MNLRRGQPWNGVPFSGQDTKNRFIQTRRHLGRGMGVDKRSLARRACCDYICERDILCLNEAGRPTRQGSPGRENRAHFGWFVCNRSRPISWRECSLSASETTMRSYVGDVLVKVPFDESDPCYQMVHAFLERAEGAMRFEEVTFCRLRRWVYMSHRLHAEQPGIEAGHLPISNGLRRCVMFVRWQGGSRLARGFDFPIPMDGRMECVWPSRSDVSRGHSHGTGGHNECGCARACVELKKQPRRLGPADEYGWTLGRGSYRTVLRQLRLVALRDPGQR
ncbi:hypothetical protein AWB68_00810 [Caballeronia choica]|uniref:Uncharacterized protein n=1 Tax=Caballeronia choica TaxID=326476 RepID=A0A158FN17_9BURK|nr:hypothetical protein AWB68_00810 [Caballeronia choica]